MNTVNNKVIGTTYCIDPQAGSDDSTGTDRDSPWQSFGPLNRLNLAPGDRVEVLAPGSFNEGLVLRGGGSPDSPVVVSFAPGRYDIYPDRAVRRQYHISNTNDGYDIPKAIGILFDGCKHIQLSGEGARLVFRGKMIEICVDHADDIRISGLQLDYHRPTVSEFRVTAAEEGHADITIHPDSAYRLEEGQIVWEGEGWMYRTGLAQELIPETDQIWRRRDPLKGMRLESLEAGRVRAHGEHNMVAGRIYQLRDTFRDCVGVFVRRSRDVVFKKVHFCYLHGMGLLCQFSENLTFDGVRVAPDPESGRTSAAWADCLHCSGCRGKILVKDALFCGAHDDAINIHGTYLRVVEQMSAKQIKVRFIHHQTYGFMAFNAGDEVQFVHADTLTSFGSNRVAEAELLNARELLLTLAEPAPSEWRENDVLENLSWSPEVEICGCTATRIPTRGFLISTPRRVLVEDNDFVRLRSKGIHVELDANKWFESGSLRDMTIRRNRFALCGNEAILIRPDSCCPDDSVHFNVRIEDNEFVLPDEGQAVWVSGTRGLVVSGNRIRTSKKLEDVIVTDGSADVTVSDNKIIDEEG